MSRTFVMLIVAGIVLAQGNSLSAQWGNLSGQFTYDGDAPAAPPINVTKDQAVCGKHDLRDESLVVNPDNKGIANVVIYLYLSRGDKAPKIHPQYEATASDKVTLDNMNCRFEPHIALVRTSQTLVVGNKDTVGHNTKVETVSRKNVPINPIIPANESIDVTFVEAERLPVLVNCSIHPWMTARVVVRDEPYMAVTDADGKFTIENLPAGKWTFQAWHEAAGYVTGGKQGSKTLKWTRGRFTQTVKEGENDLGTVAISPTLFK